MIGAHAPLCDEIPVVLQHVQMIIGHDPLHLARRPGMRRRRAEVDRLAFELLGLPVRRQVTDQPVADLGIPRVQCARRRAEPGLRPVHPQPEFQARATGIYERGCGLRAVVQPLRRSNRVLLISTRAEEAAFSGALCEIYGDRTGLVKIVGERRYGELLGGHIVGSRATELIQELVNVRALEGGYPEVARIIHGHPTLSEAVMEAARAADGWLIHG